MADDNDAIGRVAAIFMDGFITVDRERRVTGTNALFLQMLRMRPTDKKKVLDTRCCAILKLDVCTESHCAAQECMKKNAPIRLNDLKATGPEDSNFVVDVSMMPLKDAKEAVVGAMVLYRDATDERTLKMRLNLEASEAKTERAMLLKVIESREEELEKARRQIQELSGPKP